MTLLDLCRLLKRKLALVICLPIICAAIAGLYAYTTPATYDATSTIVASRDASVIGVFGTQCATNASTEETTVAATASASTNSVAFKATGPNSAECISTVNEAAKNTLELSQAQYEQMGSLDENEMPVVMELVEANRTNIDKPSTVKYAAIAFLAGLFVAMCIVVVLDMYKGNIHGPLEVEEDYEMRFIGKIPADLSDSDAQNSTSSEEMLANIRFATGEHQSVCVTPIGDPSLSVSACVQTAKAAASAKMKVLLIDTNLRTESGLAKSLHISANDETTTIAKALSDGSSSVAQAVRNSDGIHFIAAGETSDNPVSLLDTETLSFMLEQACESYDLVLVNTSSASNHSDFTYVANKCAATLLCLQGFKTKNKDVDRTISQLEIAKGNLIGFCCAD